VYLVEKCQGPCVRVLPALGEAAASGFRPPRGDGVGLRLELVAERLQRRDRAAGRVRERLCEHPIREPGVSRQQRAVEIRPDSAADATTLVATLTVVAEPGDDAPKRQRVLIEQRSARVILEAGDRS